MLIIIIIRLDGWLELLDCSMRVISFYILNLNEWVPWTEQTMLTPPEHLIGPPCSSSSLEDAVWSALNLPILSCLLDSWFFNLCSVLPPPSYLICLESVLTSISIPNISTKLKGMRMTQFLVDLCWDSFLIRVLLLVIIRCEVLSTKHPWQYAWRSGSVCTGGALQSPHEYSHGFLANLNTLIET